MANFISMLTLAWFLKFMAIIDQSSSARTLVNPSPSTHYKPHPTTTFFIHNVLTKTSPFWRPATGKINHQLPFPKPVGLFPPNGAAFIPDPTPNLPPTGFSSQTLDLSGISLSFPAVATLQELEFGKVVVIDEGLFGGAVVRPLLVGKAQGVCVASSEDGSSHMMAMTTTFAGGGFKDSLRLFGVFRSDVSESHIAVIGGTGKYDGANGYATVKAVTAGSNVSAEESKAASKPLLFSVYLS